MDVRRDRKRPQVPSYLPELLDLAFGTGRRISAILQLRYEDLRLARSPDAPHGAIVWPSSTDKERKEWRVPINPVVRRALDRILKQRPGIGSGYLFPRPADRSRPVSKELAYAWLVRAEELAQVEHLIAGGWHMFRRSWVTSRKHLPVKDVAAAGGWKDERTMLESYMQPDAATLLQVVTHRATLRSVRS
jgi:integrase